MLGLKRGTVALQPYNPAWQNSFNIESEKIKNILGNNALDVQHVGSTAIPNILAKPIIDIGLIISSFKDSKTLEKKLASLGYVLKEEDRNDRLFFTKGSENQRTHYLHVGEFGSGYIEDMISFRDYLRANKKSAEEYSQLKESLAKEHADNREKYTAAKHSFVVKILKAV